MSATLQARRPGARPAIAVTVGEPAGIGPEIAIRAAWAMRAQANCVLLGDAAFLAMTAGAIDPAIRLSALSLQAVRNGGLPHFGAGVISVIDVPLAAHVVPGTLDKENGWTPPSKASRPAGSKPWPPPRCKRAPSTTPACHSPATPNTSPTGPAPRRS
jgi:hypothetical protein